MTRVDFYVLNKPALQDRLMFACRLTEKAIKQGNKVFVATEDESASTLMNDLLWRFNPQSFVPHVVAGGDFADKTPVLISHGEDSEDHHDVLVNLRFDISPHFSRFKRVTEIVVQDDKVLLATRKNYGYYSERGYPVNTHRL